MPSLLPHLLSSNPYPGRGIVMGLCMDGQYARMAYFIMGRSENSRNRIFIMQNGVLRTQAFDPHKITDPTLIIYAPMKSLSNNIILSNGDQTDTIVEFLSRGKTFEEALQTRTFEPDAPHFTPRISGLLQQHSNCCSYKFSIIKKQHHALDHVQRFFFHYPQPVSGTGHFIHTYLGDGSPLNSFYGEPICVKLDNQPLDIFAEQLWHNLHPDYKVSLFVQDVQLTSWKTTTHIINRHQS